MNRHGGYYGENKDKIIDFSVNINPLGISENIINRVKGSINNLIRYPEIDGITARGIIEENIGIDKEKIILGNGATELIYLFSRAIKADKVLIIQPTFNEYERAFRISGSEVYNFVLTERDSFAVNESNLLNRIKELEPDVLVLCNPNNPTGKFIDYHQLISVFNYINQIDSHIFVDESFIDFTGERNFLLLVDEYSIFILRSMTKFYAIPGIRLGYGIANKGLIKRLNYYKEPWTVNSIALDILTEIFEDKGYAIKTREWLVEEKKFLKEELEKIKNLTVFNSCTNFHLCKLMKHKAEKLKEELLKKGIYIRTCEDFKGLDSRYFRIAVRTQLENKKLINGLRDLL